MKITAEPAELRVQLRLLLKEEAIGQGFRQALQMIFFIREILLIPVQDIVSGNTERYINLRMGDTTGIHYLLLILQDIMPCNSLMKTRAGSAVILQDC